MFNWLMGESSYFTFICAINLEEILRLEAERSRQEHERLMKTNLAYWYEHAWKEKPRGR